MPSPPTQVARGGPPTASSQPSPLAAPAPAPPHQGFIQDLGIIRISNPFPFLIKGRQPDHIPQGAMGHGHPLSPARRASPWSWNHTSSSVGAPAPLNPPQPQGLHQNQSPVSCKQTIPGSSSGLPLLPLQHPPHNLRCLPLPSHISPPHPHRHRTSRRGSKH